MSPSWSSRVGLVAAVACTAICWAAATAGAANAPQITVTATGHVARVGRPWSFTVRAFSADGSQALSAELTAAALVNGKNVDGIVTTGFTGTYKSRYSWPASDRGKHAALRVVVSFGTATKTLLYPVRVL